MNKTASAFSSLADTQAAAADLVQQIAATIPSPDALILFCSSKHDYPTLLRTIQEGLHPRQLVGCSSAGEFAGTRQAEGAASVIAFSSDEMAFSSGLGLGLSSNPRQTAKEIISGFQGTATDRYRYKYALVLNDPLAGFAEELIEALMLESGGGYQLFGGGAGDDAAFRKTWVFRGTEAHSNAAVALEILSNKPIGIGVRHGWKPATPLMRVTEARGSSLYSLNATPVTEVYEEFATESHQKLELTDPLPFLLHNIIGVKADAGYKLRVPLGFGGDGSLTCCVEVPTGAAVSIMSADGTAAAEAAVEAAEDAIAQLEGNKPGAALFFDCVATRLRVGKGFGNELSAVAQKLGPVPLVGCNTYGQVAQVEGQFSGFHNCTAVVCVIPE